MLIYYFDMYGKIKSHLTGQSKKEYAAFSRRIQESITDEDVLFYVQKAEQWVIWMDMIFVFYMKLLIYYHINIIDVLFSYHTIL